MADIDVFRDEYLPNAQGATVSYATWKKSYPAEHTAWVAYRDQVLAGNLPRPPTMTSKYGKALAAAGHMAERDDMKVTLSTSGGSANLEGTVTVTASPTPASQVTSVKFYVNNALQGSPDTSSPYSFLWDTSLVTPGAYELKAEAFYPRNKVATGKLDVTVLYQGAPPPPPPPPIQDPPVNTTLPAISGTATEGQTLVVSNGSWTNDPTSYTRQWSRCDAAGANCAVIASATGASYVLTAADVGKTMRCWTTAFNSVGPSAAVQTTQTAVVSALAGAVPLNTTLPVISGTAIQGYALSVSTGAWSGSPTNYSYQWLRCDTSGESCTSSAGATGTTYALTSADVGKTIRCFVTAVNSSGSSLQTRTAQTVAVTSIPVPPPQEVLSWLQPYPTTSLWRKPIPANPAIDPNNAARMTEWMANSVTGKAKVMTNRAFSIPVVVATSSSPRYTVTITSGAPTTLHSLGQVPIPLGAMPDSDSDKHLAIWDPATENEYALFDTQWNGSAWSCYGGSANNTRNSNGISPVGYASSNAANFPALAGLIRPEEIAAGVIDHPIMFGMPAASTGYVKPATHGTGSSFNALRLQAGNLLQLNPSINVDSLSIQPWEKTIARALQKYGMYLRDGGGALSLYAEGVANRKQTPDVWTNLGFDPVVSPSFSAAFPWSSMRILVPA